MTSRRMREQAGLLVAAGAGSVARLTGPAGAISPAHAPLRQQLESLVDGQLRAIATVKPAGGFVQGVARWGRRGCGARWVVRRGVVDEFAGGLIQRANARRTVEVPLKPAMCFALTDTELVFFELGGMLEKRGRPRAFLDTRRRDPSVVVAGGRAVATSRLAHAQQHAGRPIS